MSTNTHTPEKASVPAEPVIMSNPHPHALARLRRDLEAALYIIRSQDRDIAGLWRLCTACAAWGAAATLIAVFAVI